MRWIMALLAVVALALPGAAAAQTHNGGRADYDAPEVADLNIAKVTFRGGCFSYEFGGNGGFIDSEEDDFIWTGQCVAGQPINGSGIFRRITLGGRYGKGDWTETSSFYEKGVRNGKYSWKAYVTMNSPGERDFSGSGSITRGCDDAENDEYCVEDFSTLAKRLGASGGGMRGAASATDGAVGENRGKGGNPDWMYDDVDHGKCVSVEGVPATGGGGLAYGHYKLINNCAYPLEMRLCITTDRLDGSDSNYDLHRDGAKCPGMGWGAGTIDANEVQNGREWFEYNRLKWDIQVCRKGWDFIGEDDRYPSDILGLPYGCRTRRPGK